MRYDSITNSCRLAAFGAIIALVAAGQTGLASAVDGGPRTYYVDSSDGDDAASGLAPEKAWKTLGRVNSADLRGGDTVRFHRGGTWRGSLVPISGEEGAPVTYTSYGEGAKPLILGSRPRHRPEDWVREEDNVWATLPMEYAAIRQVLDLRKGHWNVHQEGGASVGLSQEETTGGTVVRVACTSSGTASNHVQLWGPTLPVEQGTSLQLTFRARCSKPVKLPAMSIRGGGSPWPSYATGVKLPGQIGSEWEEFQVIFIASESSEAGRLHMVLGGSLPAGSVLELQPADVRLVTANLSDPLTVDVGNIIFDDGKRCGWKKWSRKDLSEPYDYFYDEDSQRVFLNCPANPATLHGSIELAMKGHVVDQGGSHHVIYDGLAVMYGASHGFGGGGTHHLVIRNCDLGYIGGAHQFTTPE
ncbi:MAG: hypothetical protein ACYC6Y_06765, partial [Thermoguttaceae bacterium]